MRPGKKQEDVSKDLAANLSSVIILRASNNDYLKSVSEKEPSSQYAREDPHEDLENTLITIC